MSARDEFRQDIARALQRRSAAVINDAVGLFPFAEVKPADGELSVRLAELLMQILVDALRDRADPRGVAVSALRRVCRENQVATSELFALACLLEGSALDELALDDSIGATSESWPSIGRTVRRASIDVLAAFAERLSQEAGEDALTDPLTTLHTRPVLIAVLNKELQRAVRGKRPFALIAFDVDRFAEINAKHGYGFGDRLLERIGIVLKNYFREQDWVCRCSGDTFAVLLPETPHNDAEQLAERVRVTVQERLSLRDYGSDEQVTVTVTGAVVLVEALEPHVSAEQLLREAEHAVHRAKHAGRNRVERVHMTKTAGCVSALPDTAP